MNYFLTAATDSILIQARLDDPGPIGDIVVELHPGESFLGWTYDELRALGPGAHDLEPKEES